MANETTTPAASGGSATPAPAAPAPAPAINPSEAGRTLRQAREERRAALRSQEAAPAEGKGAHAAGSASSQASTSPASSGKTEGSAAGTAAAGTTTPGSSPSTTTDPGDAEIAAMLAENRRLKTRAAELDGREAKLKDVETLAPVMRQANELAQKGDHLGALKAAFGHLGPQFIKDTFWALLKENPEAEEAEPDLDKLLEEKLSARERAAKEAEEAKKREEGEKIAARYAKVDEQVRKPGFAAAVAAIPAIASEGPEAVEAYGSYVASVAGAFEANKAKFRAIEHFGVDPLDVVRKVETLRFEKKAVPHVLEVLQALEDDLTGTARKVVQPEAPPAPARPSIPTLTSGWRQGGGTPPPEEPTGPRTLEELRAARKRALLERAS